MAGTSCHSAVGYPRTGQTARTKPLKRDLAETLLRAQMDDTVRVVVVTGSGRAFLAGDDVTGRSVEYDAGRVLLPPSR